MLKIDWFSRHPLTDGQITTLQEAGYSEFEQHNLLFNDFIIEQIQQVTTEKVIALVAPLQYGLILLRAGYTILEFVNIPSARQKGIFICKGMNIHTLQKSNFINCPLSPEHQEEGNLNHV